MNSQERRRTSYDACFLGLDIGLDAPVNVNGRTYLPVIALATADLLLLLELELELFDVYECAPSIAGGSLTRIWQGGQREVAGARAGALGAEPSNRHSHLSPKAVMMGGLRPNRRHGYDGSAPSLAVRGMS